MSDILVVTEDPEVEVIKTTEISGIVVVGSVEPPEVIVTEVGSNVVFTTAAPEVVVFKVIEQGPQGIQGEPGADGADAVGAITGSVTGDFLRWNETTGDWEVASEPIEFKGLVLTPALAALIDAEGAIYYNSLLKSVLVCTDV